MLLSASVASHSCAFWALLSLLKALTLYLRHCDEGSNLTKYGNYPFSVGLVSEEGWDCQPCETREFAL